MSTGAAVDSVTVKENTRLALDAMGTRFEVLLHASRADFATDPNALAEAALEEIAILERELSLFRRDSVLSYVNASAAERPVRVAPDLFELFVFCDGVRRASGGAFDIAVGALMKAFGFHGDAPSIEPITAPGEPRTCPGRLLLDREACTLRFERSGMRLDLGGVAKGFALDRAADVLRDEGVTRALIHGGTSTVVGISDSGVWNVGIRAPGNGRSAPGAPGALLAKARLANSALSVSAPHGRTVVADGRALGHLIDPATGAPADGTLLAAVTARSGALADAWSTALLAAGPDRFESLVARAEGVQAALLYAGPTGEESLRIAGPHPETFAQPDAAERDEPADTLEKVRK